MSHKWAGPFLQPVDPIALDLPDYFDIVKNPMDFGTLQRRIETQMVTSKEEFAALALPNLRQRAAVQQAGFRRVCVVAHGES